MPTQSRHRHTALTHCFPNHTPAARTGPLAAAAKSSGDDSKGGYVPAGLTRAQWAEIQAADAAKKATKKEKPKKIEVRMFVNVCVCVCVWCCVK